MEFTPAMLKAPHALTPASEHTPSPLMSAIEIGATAFIPSAATDPTAFMPMDTAPIARMPPIATTPVAMPPMAMTPVAVLPTERNANSPLFEYQRMVPEQHSALALARSSSFRRVNDAGASHRCSMVLEDVPHGVRAPLASRPRAEAPPAVRRNPV